MYEQYIRPSLFALLRDPESAHNVTARLLQIAQDTPYVLEWVRNHYAPAIKPNPVTIAGLTFPNRVGLAAGFDKQARLLPILEAIGFGHVEVGTVLPRPQTGNPRPRIFRLPYHETLLNRMGFNSDGAVRVAERLVEMEARVKIPIGISLSKQKETKPEEAVLDFLETQRITSPYAAYFTVNLSSPNTPGLRAMQTKEFVCDIGGEVVKKEAERFRAYNNPTKPVFLKVASDIEYPDLYAAIEGAVEAGMSGIILGNTALKRPPYIPAYLDPGGGGGWSGPGLFAQVLERLQIVKRLSTLPVILAGGIGHPDHVKRARDLGAALIQIYTSFIYKGPRVVQDLVSVPW